MQTENQNRSQKSPNNPAGWGWMRRLVRLFVARFRLNKRIVCEESAALGVIDFHDYTDTKEGDPWHMALHTCERCGKRFFI
jgi:hypothetical protein